MAVSTISLRRIFAETEWDSNSGIVTAVGLSLLFLGVVTLAHIGLRQLDPEIVVVALVPLVVLLAAFGVLKEIQTPTGFKLFFNQRLRETRSLQFNPLRKFESVENAVVDASESESSDRNIDPKSITRLVNDANTHVVSFKIKEEIPYTEKTVAAYMNAIIEDPGMTIRYLQFTKSGKFMGLIRLSDTFHNRIILSAVSPDGLDWSGLTKDINNGDVLYYPGTITTESISVRTTAKEALQRMQEHDRNWLPVTEENKLVGVISEDQLLREMILELTEEGTDDETTANAGVTDQRDAATA